jgi:transcriptional regulator with XRE-family HTH domain
MKKGSTRCAIEGHRNYAGAHHEPIDSMMESIGSSEEPNEAIIDSFGSLLEPAQTICYNHVRHTNQTIGDRMSDLAQTARVPTEQLPITLFDGIVLAARADDGLIWLVLRDLCTTLHLSLAAQRRRINDDKDLHLTQLRIRGARQVRTLDALLLDDIPVWLIRMQRERLDQEVQPRIEYIQTYLISAVRAAFAQLTNLPDAPSNMIEDLQELDRIDQALREARLKAGMTVREASAATGIAHSMIVKYENGVIPAPLTRLDTLARAYDIAPAALLSTQDSAVDVLSTIDRADTRAIKLIADALQTLK